MDDHFNFDFNIIELFRNIFIIKGQCMTDLMNESELLSYKEKRINNSIENFIGYCSDRIKSNCVYNETKEYLPTFLSPYKDEIKDVLEKEGYRVFVKYSIITKEYIFIIQWGEEKSLYNKIEKIFLENIGLYLPLLFFIVIFSIISFIKI